jgi:hypothetical protein
LQPNAMFYAAQMQHGMPTVRALSQLAIVQITKIQASMCVRAYEQRRPYRNDRDRSLGRPEDGLFGEGQIRVSCEKPTPKAVGTQCQR